MAKYTTNIQMAEFDGNGLAIEAGWVEVYHCHAQTREFLGKSYDSVPVGFSIVSDAYLDEPELPEAEDIAVIRSPDETCWLQVPDYRGKTAYHIKTQAPQRVQKIGELAIDLTLLEPNTPFDKWEGKKWVTDTMAKQRHDKQQAEKQREELREQAEKIITPLQYAVDTGLATEAEEHTLMAWKKYLVTLIRLDISDTTKIIWPERPDVAA
ncbi:tail fiber assembly protein [Xenorhabdus bovienii]|uniref:tail fiber assembly protein n=1 Tax=Xenorhabdus bovienii TaxID=40576 RepID=UPI001EDF4F28|nr:tail fiber assembly protein [Xenorhabdus bovienii]MCG3462015.1 tail fiber assembly protein [Xenorhabdus bovienii]